MPKIERSSIAFSCAAFSSFQYRGSRSIASAGVQLPALCMPMRTLSSTVRLEKRRMFWKFRAAENGAF